MLFTAFPSPSGYTPPRRGANPVLIVLGVCGGCAVLAVIVVIALGAFGVKKFQPMLQRTVTTAQFLKDVQEHKYSDAEALLSPEAQQTMPLDKLTKTADSLEQKYGSLQRFQQDGMDISNQTDPNSLRELSYKLHYQNGTSRISLRFDPNGSANRISEIQWDTTDDSGSGSETTPKKPKGAHKGGARSGSEE